MPPGVRTATAVAASIGGAVATFLTTTAHKAHNQPINADSTAFQRHYSVRDFPAPTHQLINNFWFPHFPPTTFPANEVPFHHLGVGGANNFFNFGLPPNHNDDDEDAGDDFTEFDVTSSAAAALGTTLFHHGYRRAISLQEAVRRSRRILERHREEIGDPGLVVGVSIDGEVVWTEGLGWADFENRVACHADTVMRIASIGKAISMTIIAKLWEEGKLDLDKPVQEYVPEFPLKEFDGQPVTITCRQLVSHLSGIRHYSKTKKPDNDDKAKLLLPGAKTTLTETEKAAAVARPAYNEFNESEYYLQKPFKSTLESVGLFKDDPLLNKPDEEFLYTTHGWTLLSAVIESVTKRKLTDVLKDLFRDLNMTNTFLDEHEPSNYRRSKSGCLRNAPFVDNSYKWAGGGLLSTAGDLLKFAHLLLSSYQHTKEPSPGYLKSSTLKALWSLVDKTKKDEYADKGYGMGWMVVPERTVGAFCLRQPHIVYHTAERSEPAPCWPSFPGSVTRTGMDPAAPPPEGIVVTTFANLEQAALYKKSIEIAQIFDQVERGGAC
ncbi:Serine beta-lactamase-like protein LACTB, mitochondrial [Hypsibius exemplaris]|uniref:Serine beta-lactamase-like protein LACTB, mitochondrial n=1 Tax=Hypsibius exemplaris TaxID=2072580 RepID=A0A1W0WS15_HYPEX|nr:Serine beta-lactamase-like protein LACTB, mitochondrial [Hypsibius exemplaris]